MNLNGLRWMLILSVSIIVTACHETLKPHEISIRPDVVYGHKSGMALVMDAYIPSNANGAGVILVQSGGFNSGIMKQYAEEMPGKYRLLEAKEMLLELGDTAIHYPPMKQFSFAALLDEGYTVFDVKHGSNPKFTLDEIVRDVKRAVRFIKYHAPDFGIDPERLGIWGASSGGYLAVFTAVSNSTIINKTHDPVNRMNNTVAAICAYYPAGYDFCRDVHEFPFIQEAIPAMDIDSLILDELSIKHYITPDDPPVLIIYGDQDMPFIIEPSEAIYSDYVDAGIDARKIVIPGIGHEFRSDDGYDEFQGKEAMKEMILWFEKYLLDIQIL